MSKLVWDAIGERYYETGVDHGVLYPVENGQYPRGYAWNGLTNISESPSGAEQSPLYADNIKYLTLTSAEEFGLTIEAYTYPDEWEACDGTGTLASGVKIGQQGRKKFGLSYRTKLGNDTDGDTHGYKLHLVYGCSASPSERSYATVNDSPEAITFSWEVTTTPITLDGYNPIALITIDSTQVDQEKLAALEAILYGTDATGGSSTPSTNNSDNSDPDNQTGTGDDGDDQGGDDDQPTGETDARLPLPSEIKSLFAEG